MRDLNKSNGRALLTTSKRSGKTASAMSHSGLAKTAPLTTTSHAPQGTFQGQGLPASRVSRTSDFEGFGSFSS